MTKKKTLLKEGTVRQFMKLANLKPLASEFVDKLYESEELQEEAPYGGNKGDDSRSKKDYDIDEGAYGGNKGDDSRSKKDYMEEEAPYGGNKGDDSRSKKDYLEEEEENPPEDAYQKKNSKAANKIQTAESLTEDDAADDDWGGNEGDESETDPGHIDYEGDEGGDVDVHSLVRAIAGAIESETGVSVDVAEEEEEAEIENHEGEEEMEATATLDDEEVDLEGGGELGDLEEVISTIAENVTKRLQKMTSEERKKKAGALSKK